MDENITHNEGGDRMALNTKSNNEIEDRLLNEAESRSKWLSNAIDHSNRMLDRDIDFDKMDFILVSWSDSKYQAPIKQFIMYHQEPVGQKMLPTSQEGSDKHRAERLSPNIFSIYSGFLDSLHSFAERVQQRQVLQVDENPEEVLCAVSDCLGAIPVEKQKKHPKMIYRVHAEGHLVVISQYSENKTDVFKCPASTELLCDIICQKKQPVIIDLDRLSNLQVAGIKKALHGIQTQITVKAVNKNGKKLWVIKYKR